MAIKSDPVAPQGCLCQETLQWRNGIFMGLENVMALRSKAFFAGLVCVLAIACLCDSITRKVYFSQNLCGIADVLGLEKQPYSIEYVVEEPQILFSDTSLLIVLKLKNPWCPGASIVEADAADTKFGIDAINELKPASDQDELPRTIYRFGFRRFSCYACYSCQLSKMYIFVMGT